MARSINRSQAAQASPMRRSRTTSSHTKSELPFPAFYQNASQFSSTAMTASLSSPGEFMVPHSFSNSSLPALSTSSSDSSASTSPSYFETSFNPRHSYSDFSPASSIPSSHFLQRSGSLPALYSQHSPTYEGVQASHHMHHRASLPLAIEQSPDFSGLQADQQEYSYGPTSPQKQARANRFSQYRSAFNKSSSPPQTPDAGLHNSTASYHSDSNEHRTPTTSFSPKLTMASSYKFNRPLIDQMSRYQSPGAGFDGASRAMHNALPLAQPIAINPMHQFNHQAGEEETLYYAGPIGSAAENCLAAIPEHFMMSSDGMNGMGMVTDAELLDIQYGQLFQSQDCNHSLSYGHYSSDNSTFH